MSDPVVTRDQVMKASEGMLRKQLYVIFTTPVNGLGPVMAVIKEHLDFQMDLERRGIMVGAGPFWNEDETQWHGEGMVIVRASSMAEARKIAEEDPMHSTGARSFTVRPWLMNEGTVTVRLTYSSGKMEML